MNKVKSNNKVLMVAWLFPPSFAGAAVQSIRLGKALLSKGVDVEFVADNGAEKTLHETYEGVTVTRIKTYSNNTHSKLRELVFCLKLLIYVISRPDFKIIHFHAIRGFETLLFPMLRLLGRKVLFKLTLVDADDPVTLKNRKLFGFLYFLGLKCANGIFAISNQLKDRSLQAGIPENKIIKVFNGFDEKLFYIPEHQLKLSLRKEFNFDENVRVFISVGTVEHRKGYDLLLQAFSIIQLKYPDAVLLIIGPYYNADSFYQELEELILKLDLKNVMFLGKQTDVHEYYKAADHFLFCSRQEGFPSVIIEAMACGLLATVMDIPGITEEIIEDSVVGAVCYSRDPVDFAQLAIQQMQSIDINQIQLSADNLLKKFSINKIAEDYIYHYNKILNLSDS